VAPQGAHLAPVGFVDRWPMVSAPPNALGARRLAVTVPRDVTAGAHAPPDPVMLRLGGGLAAPSALPRRIPVKGNSGKATGRGCPATRSVPAFSTILGFHPPGGNSSAAAGRHSAGLYKELCSPVDVQINFRHNPRSTRGRGQFGRCGGAVGCRHPRRFRDHRGAKPPDLPPPGG